MTLISRLNEVLFDIDIDILNKIDPQAVEVDALDFRFNRLALRRCSQAISYGRPPKTGILKPQERIPENSLFG